MSWRKQVPLQTVSPIRAGQPIVDSNGAPVPAFVRQFNEHWPNVQATLSKAEAAQATASAAVPQSRKINTTSPIQGGGPLTADLTLTHANSGVTANTYGDGTHIPQFTVNATGHITAVSLIAVTATGTVTTTGSPASGNLTKFSGATSVTNGDLSGDVTTSGTLVTTLANTAVTPGTYGDSSHSLTVTVDGKGRLTAISTNAIAGGGSVTTTGSPASGNLTKFSGASSITNGDLSGDVTTSGTLATTIANNAVTTAKINNSAVTLAKIANASANSVLLGAGASGSGAAYAEIALGTGLTMTGTTLSASGGGGGGGSGATRMVFPAASFTTNDTGAFATLSNAFIPAESVTIDRLYGSWDNQTIGNVYSMFIATVDGSGNITGTVATATSRFTTTATGKQSHAFPISAATLSAGTTYIIALVITSGTTTTACRAIANSSSTTCPYPDLPDDFGAELALNVKRYWYAQNSDAPSSGAPSSSNASGQYYLGMRATATAGPWSLVATSSPSGVTHVDFTNLGTPNEILVIGRNLTTASSTFRSINVSTDNGVSFYSTSGNYVECDTNGTETNKASIATTTNATTALTVQALIHNASNGAVARSSNAGAIRLFTASTSQINAVQVIAGSGNITGGTIYVWTR